MKNEVNLPRKMIEEIQTIMLTARENSAYSSGKEEM